jgi:ribosomal protein S27E
VSATGRGPDRLSQYPMQIECPQCGQKMTVQIGFSDPEDYEIECLGCHNTLVPFLPGPIVDGPFPD